jgi:hypothetical protein
VLVVVRVVDQFDLRDDVVDAAELGEGRLLTSGPIGGGS